MEDQALPCGCTVIRDKVVNWCEIHRDPRGREMLLHQRDKIASLEAENERLTALVEVLRKEHADVKEADAVLRRIDGNIHIDELLKSFAAAKRALEGK